MFLYEILFLFHSWRSDSGIRPGYEPNIFYASFTHIKIISSHLAIQLHRKLKGEQNRKVIQNIPWNTRPTFYDIKKGRQFDDLEDFSCPIYNSNFAKRKLWAQKPGFFSQLLSYTIFSLLNTEIYSRLSSDIILFFSVDNSHMCDIEERQKYYFNDITNERYLHISLCGLHFIWTLNIQQVVKALWFYASPKEFLLTFSLIDFSYSSYWFILLKRNFLLHNFDLS